MSDAPLVTIMIPTYGQADMLPRAIESALAQDYPSLEVVVGDDASPDATAETVQPYLQDPRFRYVRHGTNLGRVANYRTMLYQHARGAYVLNLDGDDWLIDDTFVGDAARMMASEPGMTLVFARAWKYDAATGRYAQNEGRNRGLLDVNEGNEIFLAHATGTVSIPHLAALYRRDHALELDFYRLDVLGSDTESLLRLVVGRKVGFLDREVGVWHAHGDNATRTYDVDERLRNLAVSDSAYRYALERGAFPRARLDRWYRKMVTKSCLSIAVDGLHEGQLRDVARFLAGVTVSRPRIAVRLAAAFPTRATRRLTGRRSVGRTGHV